MDRKNILGISGSIRNGSSNKMILRHIAEKYKDRLDIEIYEDAKDLPHFNPDLIGEDLPEKVKRFRERIEGADGVIISSPEYVFSMPGVLKNAIEWQVSTTVFSGKPVGLIVGAATGETTFESLHLLMSTVEAKIANGARLLIKGARGKMDVNGNITDSNTLESIDKMINAFIESIDPSKD